MHILVDISAHGLGHLSQTAPVIEAIKLRVPMLRVTLRSALPRSQLKRAIATNFDHVPETRDFGFLMRNAVDIDLTASGTAYRDFHQDWQDRIAIEVGWLKKYKVDAVLTNVAYLPLAAAARAGIPSASLCSINWADLFIHYFAKEPWAAKIYDEMLSAYLDARCFLRVSPGLPMANLLRRRNIGTIARVGRRDRRSLSQRLDIREANRWILLAMGGMEFRLPVESWPSTPGFTWLVPDSWQVIREDVRAFDNTGIDFGDVLASVDAVITKPGYGTFVEAACGGIPILYLQRDDWPETAYLAEWLATNARSQVLTRSCLMKGEVIDALMQLWNEPAPNAPFATGVNEAVELLEKIFRLG